jgi:hypothetical protein
MKSRIDQEVDAEAAAVRSTMLSSARSLDEANSIRAFLDKNDLATRAAVAQEKEERKTKAIFKSTQMQEALSTGKNLEKLSDRVDKLTGKLTGFGTDRKGNLVTLNSKGDEFPATAAEKILHQGIITELSLKTDQLVKEERRARPLASSIEEADKTKTKGALQKFMEGLANTFSVVPVGQGNEQVSAPQPGATSPFPDFPDAFVQGGQWIVIRDGQKFKVNP